MTNRAAHLLLTFFVRIYQSSIPVDSAYALASDPIGRAKFWHTIRCRAIWWIQFLLSWMWPSKSIWRDAAVLVPVCAKINKGNERIRQIDRMNLKLKMVRVCVCVFSWCRIDQCLYKMQTHDECLPGRKWNQISKVECVCTKFSSGVSGIAQKKSLCGRTMETIVTKTIEKG